MYLKREHFSLAKKLYIKSRLLTHPFPLLWMYLAMCFPFRRREIFFGGTVVFVCPGKEGANIYTGFDSFFSVTKRTNKKTYLKNQKKKNRSVDVFSCVSRYRLLLTLFSHLHTGLPVFVVGFSRPLKSQHTCTKAAGTTTITITKKKDHRRNKRGQ